MIEKGWALLKAEFNLIRQDAKSFFAAVMVGLVAVLIVLLFKFGIWLKASTDGQLKSKDDRISDKERQNQQIIEIGRAGLRSLQRESDWRDTAQKYKTLYLELKK